MKKRKIQFGCVLAGSLLCVAAAFCFAVPLGIAVLVAAIPVIYLGYKPMIPTPAPIWFQYNNRLKPMFCKKPAPSPKVALGGYQEPEYQDFDADFYIATNGCDTNDGTKDAPFATFERAKEAVRQMDKTGKTSVTVAVCAGRYSVEQVRFAEEDGGSESCPVVYKAYGGEVVIDGGFSIPTEAFSKVSDQEIRERLAPAAREHILVADLEKLGLTGQQIGPIHVFGTYHTAAFYDGDWEGALHCELFVNDSRQTIARWPNGDTYAKTGKVLYFAGGTEAEHVGSTDSEWRKRRNPKSDIYKIDRTLAKRIASWKTLKDVWMFGFWMYDWADAATPIGSFDAKKRTLSPKFLSQWGARKGAPYYFFNILEELDAPGEWYLDRDTLKLYWYPNHSLDDARIMLSVTTKSVLKVEGASHLTFDGFTVQGTRGNAIEVEGDHITFCNGTIRNSAGEAIIINGCNNKVSNCHITAMGRGGITLNGGDRETLTPGDSIVENNLIHGWSEVNKTYCPAVLIQGVGNICRHNEMYDSPHEVIWIHGNDHVVEYNHIHHACLLTKDGGAIYAGKNWSYYGTQIRYNCIHDLGTPYYTACAIYMDDAISGHSICGNLLVNIPGIAIQLGGGRDFVVKDNVIVNCTNTPISYDNRAREGAFYGTWFHYCSEPGGYMWKLLWDSPYKNPVWQKRYPQLAAFYEEFDRPEDPYFVPNPGNSQVQDNLIVDGSPFHGNILCKEAKKFGKIQNNRIVPMRHLERLFPNAMQGNYERRGDTQ